MKSLYIWLGAVFVIASANSQNSLSGTVNSLENEPLSATIYLPQLEKGTIAGLDGTYTISNIPNGTYKVIYSLLGYATVSRTVLFSEGKEEIVPITLEESAVEIEEVIISTPFHKLQSDNVMKVERISMDQLKKQGSTTLSEGITNIPGVASISTGTSIGKPVIRGLSANRVLTYAQGVRLENQQFGDEHGLGINGAGVESVEVIKGPATLLYGSDALGGVLYLNPERFAAADSLHVDLETTYFTNTLGSASNMGFKTSSEKFRFLLRAMYGTHSDYKTGNDLGVINSRFNETDITSGVQFQNTKLKSTLRYNYNRSNLGLPESLGETSSSRELLAPYQEVDNHILSWDNVFFFNNSSLHAKVGYLFNDRREFEEAEEPNTPKMDEAALRLKLNTLNYDLAYHLPLMGKFETIVGLQGMYQTNENFGEEILIPDATTKDIGILATTHYHVEKLDIQAGLRLDNRVLESEASGTVDDPEYIPALDRSFSSLNAAIGVKWDVTKQLLGRLNLASGFRAPNLAELTSNGVHEGTNRYEVGNPNLTNEQNFQTDLSLEFRNDHFELIANGFYNTINDYIFITPTGTFIDENPVFDYVQNDAYLYGGEFGLHIHPHPLDWLHVESSFETVTGKLSSEAFLPLIPANALTNTLRVEFNPGTIRKDSYTFIRLKNVFDQSNVSTFETSTPGYSLLSIGGGSSFQFKEVLLEGSLTVNNLTNETYISHLSRLKNDGIPDIGRNILIRLKLSI
ncbi:MAG: TonB-dependent receptor [Altibacter sp.]|nr:TonB-dependent receptor [Altibacter sp.]